MGVKADGESGEMWGEKIETFIQWHRLIKPLVGIEVGVRFYDIKKGVRFFV